MRQFVLRHASPYDPRTDDYDLPAFHQDIVTTKATAIYAMHSYHQGKKPHEAIRRHIRHYTRPGDLVLDPFCGSGGTALAALIEGRVALAVDRSPAAVFIAGNYCAAPDPAALEPAFGELLDPLRPELDWLYETRCDRCGGAARTTFTLLSERFRCPRCASAVALADCLPAEGGPAAGGRRRLAACPHCRRAGRVEPIGPPGQRLGAVPVLAAYRCLGPCGPAADQRRHDDPDPRKRRFFQKYDLGKIREIEALPIPYWRPTAEFPKTFARWQSDLRPAGIERVDQLYTKRNLWALAALRARALRSACPDQALFALTAICLAASKMQRYSPRSGFPNMLLTGTYYVPPVGREIEVGSWYAGKVRALLRGYTAIRQHLPTPAARLIAAGDARKLAIPANSVDYIFTDPPYADAVQYGELNFVWESWLGAESQWHADEIVVNAARGKTEEEWARGLGQAMRECCRVLKPGRWLSLCYHDTSERRWATIQDLMAAAGLVVDTADSPPSIDTGQKSFNQFMTDKATKRDLVVNFRKPRPGTRRPTTKDGRRTTDDGRRATGPRRVGRAQRAPPKRRATEDGAKRPRPSPVVRRPSATAGEGLPAFERSARRIIREYLRAHPGATQDRIYDELIRRMIRRGRLQPHDFQALLRSVAREARPQRSGGAGRKTGAQAAARWYLKPRRG